jgi:hypothetical protein
VRNLHINVFVVEPSRRSASCSSSHPKNISPIQRENDEDSIVTLNSSYLLVNKVFPPVHFLFPGIVLKVPPMAVRTVHYNK